MSKNISAHSAVKKSIIKSYNAIFPGKKILLVQLFNSFINKFLIFFFRDMCASEDIEVETSILKIREDSAKKSKCCG